MKYYGVLYIKEANGKFLDAKEISGLLPVSKIKPKKNVQNTRVTQICDSMERKEVLNVAESLKKQTEEKVIAKAENLLDLLT